MTSQRGLMKASRVLTRSIHTPPRSTSTSPAPSSSIPPFEAISIPRQEYRNASLFPSSPLRQLSTSTSSPSTPPPPSHPNFDPSITTTTAESRLKHSPLKVSIVTTLAKMMGYNMDSVAAKQSTANYYERCARRDLDEEVFFHEVCALPRSFQTWFQITNLHIWLLQVRFRSLPSPLGRAYIQEIINHFFTDAEYRMRGQYKITSGSVVKGYMRDMLQQYHGSVAAYDEGLIAGDAILAAAIWRNFFGGGWGTLEGVKGKKPPRLPDGSVPEAKNKENPQAVDPELVGQGEDSTRLEDGVSPLVRSEAEFVFALERLVTFVRREVNRVENLPEENVKRDGGVGDQNVAGFTRI